MYTNQYIRINIAVGNGTSYQSINQSSRQNKAHYSDVYIEMNEIQFNLIRYYFNFLKFPVEAIPQCTLKE